MSQIAVNELLFFMDDAFEKARSHALLINLASVTEGDYARDHEGRSIREMVRHLAAAKHVYNNQAFGDGSLFMPNFQERIYESDAGMAEDLDWLKHGYQELRTSLAALDDSDLATPRPVHWGEKLDTRTIVAIMIEHDLYHAGEINHLRSILQENDYWRGREPGK
jgi:uncharacterized damage-inducible protein DinB